MNRNKLHYFLNNKRVELVISICVEDYLNLVNAKLMLLEDKIVNDNENPGIFTINSILNEINKELGVKQEYIIALNNKGFTTDNINNTETMLIVRYMKNEETV